MMRRQHDEGRDLQFSVESIMHHTVGIMVWVATAGIHLRLNVRCAFHPGSGGTTCSALDSDSLNPPTLAHFEENQVDFLLWSHTSPDLSPIEHIWDIMERKLLHVPHPLTESTDTSSCQG